MPDNQLFIEKTDFLKNEKKINYSVQAEKLRIERHVFDSYRAERVAVPGYIEQRMIVDFPELADFEERKNTTTDVVHEPMVLYSDGNAWKEAYLTQKKLIEMQNMELERLRKDVERLGAENKALKDIFKERDRKI
jgi:hypothetical protein